MSKLIYLNAFLLLLVTSCGSTSKHDASGSFEAEEIIVSSEQNGKIISLTINEGDVLEKNQVLGQIDVSSDKLKAEQIEASIQALQKKTNNPDAQTRLVEKQLNLLQSQLAQLTRERTRISNLVKADAATQKQLDDVNAQIDQLQKQELVTKQQLNVSLSTIKTQNSGILSEKEPLEKSAAQVRNQIAKGQIISPIHGTVLLKYAYEGELASVGKALFKIANTDTLIFKSFITATQLSSLRLGQTVKVFIDQDKKSFKEYTGRVSWISTKAEFTPKTILTKDERSNLVYAIKVRVPNDGFLKIGMYGEMNFQ